MGQTILITGFSGFVGRYLLNELNRQKNFLKVVGVDIVSPSFELSNNVTFLNINLLDEQRVIDLINEHRPNFIIHLASFSKVSESWIDPINSFKNNTNIFLNLIEAVRKCELETKFLSVGSSEEYGIVDEKAIPLREEDTLNPNSPYSVARVSQEWMSKVYATGFGMDIVMTRSFNHYGIYQSDSFVLPSIVRQLSEIKNDQKEKSILVGNIDIIRDFIHVSDVAKAYLLLLDKGKSGEVYNICTGRGITLREVIGLISKKLDINPEIEINKEFYRPNDNPIIVGSNDKLKALGWNPELGLEDGLSELIEHYSNRFK